MLHICDESICKPLESSELKKSIMIPVFKKCNKQELKNYSPISLLPASGKIVERLLYNSMFKFFSKDSLISETTA